MSVLSPRAQILFDVARRALPTWLFAQDETSELVAQSAKALAATWDQIDYFVDQVFILRADSPFLDELARDKGTRRQDGETDAGLAIRLRQVSDAITIPALQAALDAITTGAGLAEGAIVELRAGRAHLTTLDATVNAVAAAGITDGQTFTVDDSGAGVFGTPRIFEFDKNGSVGGGHFAVDISTAVTDVDVAIAIVTAINANMTHVTASRPIGALPQAVKLRSDAYLFRAVQARNDNVTATGFTVVTGAHRFYLGRGYRVSARHNELIIILPYGTPTSVQQAVADMARQLKAGGVDVIIEVRANP